LALLQGATVIRAASDRQADLGLGPAREADLGINHSDKVCLTTSKLLCSTHVVAATYVFFTGYPMHGVGIRTGERR